MMNLRNRAKRIGWLRATRTVARTLRQMGLSLRWVGGLFRLGGFAREYRSFRRLNRESPFRLRGGDILPCLGDRTKTTPVEPTYFLQDAWLARKLAAELYKSAGKWAEADNKPAANSSDSTATSPPKMLGPSSRCIRSEITKMLPPSAKTSVVSSWCAFDANLTLGNCVNGTAT